MPVRFPQLLTAPAPSWLNEGVMATYSALVGSSETEYLEHKNLEAGQAGNGINQLDIVAIEDGQAAIMNDANGLVFEKTNQMDFRELFTYDLDGKLVQAYYEYNPDVMTSSGFGSVKTIILQLVE